MYKRQGEVIEVGTDNTYSGGLSVSLPVFAPALYKSISLTSTDAVSYTHLDVYKRQLLR